MHVEFVDGSREFVQIDDVEIIFRHFSGKADDDFHRAGERDFTLVIKDKEIAEAFLDKGYNVVYKENYDEWRLKVKLGFKVDVPNIYLVTNGRVTVLDEESVACLDNVEIQRVDLDIRPYDWGPINGKSGRTAYVKNLRVEQVVDRFAAELAEEEHPEDDIPF